MNKSLSTFVPQNTLIWVFRPSPQPVSGYTLSNFPSVALTETKISFLFPECVSVNIGDINSWGRQWPIINLAEYLKRVFGQESKSTKERARGGVGVGVG